MPPNAIARVAPALLTDDATEPDGVEVSGPAGQTDCESLALPRALQHAVGAQSYQLWFRDRTKLTIQGDELVVGVVSPFVMTFLQRQFRQQIGDVAASLLGPAARVRFEIDASLALVADAASVRKPAVNLQPKSHAVEGAVPSKPDHAPVSVVGSTPTSSLRPDESGHYKRGTGRPGESGRSKQSGSSGRRFSNLSDFVVGSCNQLGAAASRQVSEAPGERHNPLYLFGGVGLGKTHLLEGIYCELRRRFPTLNVVFLTSEQFANYFTHALRTHTLPSFRQRFRSVDVLLVDDIDFFDGKRATQEEFLHTIKTLESQGRQIVVTADRHPRLLSQISDELTSRFLSGLVCRLEAPDLETRTKIVQHKLTRHELELTPDAVALVAHWFQKNVRELEGALNCLAAHFALGRQRMTASMARQILADLQRDCVRIVRLADVERAICDLFRLIPDELRSPSRARHVAQPRMLAMFLARKLTQSAYSEIGEFFGGRNHSTVISAERQVQGWLTDETKFRIAAREWSVGELVQTLEQQLIAS